MSRVEVIVGLGNEYKAQVEKWVRRYGKVYCDRIVSNALTIIRGKDKSVVVTVRGRPPKTKYIPCKAKICICQKYITYKEAKTVQQWIKEVVIV